MLKHVDTSVSLRINGIVQSISVIKDYPGVKIALLNEIKVK